MHSVHARSGLAILSRVRPYGLRFNSTKPPRYLQFEPPQDPSTKIPDPRIVPPDHGEPAGPFPSTLLYENHPPATPGTVKAMEDAKSRPSSSSTTPAHPFTTRALVDEEAGTDQRPIVEYCNAHSIIVQAYCPLVRGQGWDNPVLKDVAEKHRKEISQILVRWSLQKGYSPLPKSSQAHRVKSNAQVYDFELSDEEMVKIDTLDKGASGALSWNPVNSV